MINSFQDPKQEEQRIEIWYLVCDLWDIQADLGTLHSIEQVWENHIKNYSKSFCS